MRSCSLEDVAGRAPGLVVARGTGLVRGRLRFAPRGAVGLPLHFSIRDGKERAGVAGHWWLGCCSHPFLLRALGRSRGASRSGDR